MSRNWKRDYVFEAGKAGSVGFKVTDLKIEFQIDKSEDETANNTTISIWNLNDEHIATLEEKDCVVILSAGYDGDVKQIFTGYVVFVSGEPDGGDWKTEITVVDGRKELRDTQVSKSYNGSVNSKTVIDDIAREMNVSVTYADDLKHIDMDNYAFVGNAKESLDKVCTSAGFQWSIQDGALQVKRKYGVMDRTGYVLSADSGLIGWPKKVRKSEENNSDNDEYGWEVQFFLNGDININDYVYLDSKKAKGFFRVSKLSIGGSNLDGDWICQATLFEEKNGSGGAGSSSGVSKSTGISGESGGHWGGTTTHVSQNGETHGGGGGKF